MAIVAQSFCEITQHAPLFVAHVSPQFYQNLQPISEDIASHPDRLQA